MPTSVSYRGSGQAQVLLECTMQQTNVTCLRANPLMSACPHASNICLLHHALQWHLCLS